MTLLIQNAVIYTPAERLEVGAVLVEGGFIQIVGKAELPEAKAGARCIDASGLILVPGLIDLQVNGAFGCDFTSQPETIWEVAAGLPRYGVTAFLPTIVTSPAEVISRAQAVLAGGKPAGFRGAEPLGLHLEGPFLNPEKKGAHNPAYLRLPDTRLIADWSPHSHVRLVTLAPELPGALELVELLVNRGVRVSAGHSTATVDQSLAGYRAGISYATHLFNAMPALGHRQPGLVGAALGEADWVTGLIPDGIHVHPVVMKLIWQLKGSQGLNLVSDAMAALGMPPGVYRLQDFEVTVSQRDARLSDGTLAGSILPLDQALRNLIAYIGCSFEEALGTVTTTPARLLGLEQERGQISAGMVADLTLLDTELNVRMTIAAGEIVYQAPGCSF